MDKMHVIQLQNKLKTEITKHFPEWKIETLKLAGQGVENAVFSIETEGRALLAIRVPWSRVVSNDNDGELDSRYQLKKEAEIASHCYDHGLPIPKVIKLHLGKDIDFLASQFVQGDHSVPSSYDIGSLTAKLHRMPIKKFDSVDSRKISKILSERMTKRLGVFNRITVSSVILPEESEMEAILRSDNEKASLLHMDIRPANIICKDGRIEAIVDWNNALIGSPALDIMRTIETCEVDESMFLEGYGNIEVLHHTPTIVRLLYRLDTAVMLAVLFHTYAKDQVKAKFYAERVIMLAKQIEMEA